MACALLMLAVKHAEIVIPGKEFLATTIIVSLRVLTFALNVFFQRVQLIDLGLQRALIDGRTCRRLAQLADFRFQRRPARLHLRELVLRLLKLAVQLRHYAVELRDSGFLIEEEIGVDDRHLAHRQLHWSSGSRRWSCRSRSGLRSRRTSGGLLRVG